MSGDICIIKVFFDTCDKPILSPVRVIIDEKTARHGVYFAARLTHLNIYSHPKFPFIIIKKQMRATFLAMGLKHCRVIQHWIYDWHPSK